MRKPEPCTLETPQLRLEPMTAAHAAAKAIDPAKALDGMPIPLHPGAERYYKEAGLLK